MSNTVYEKATEYAPARDSAWVAREYMDHSVYIANVVSNLNERLDRIEYLHQITKDNCDVAVDLEAAIGKLGIALATCVEYCNEYTKESQEDAGDENG